MKEYFVENLGNIGLNISEEKIEKLYIYFKLLVKTNKTINLTAIRDKKDMIEKHFIDSLLLQKYFEGKSGTAIDIGTGAGFPGMVLAIVNPDITFTLMDSVGKKTKFLEKVKKELALENVEVVNERAEDFMKEANRREYYDYGLCRGVSEIRIILEYVIPFIKVNGMFYMQKMNFEKELEEAKNSLLVLNSKVINIFETELPISKDKRIVIEVKKEKETESRYPRRSGVPAKRPL